MLIQSVKSDERIKHTLFTEHAEVVIISLYRSQSLHEPLSVYYTTSYRISSSLKINFHFILSMKVL